MQNMGEGLAKSHRASLPRLSVEEDVPLTSDHRVVHEDLNIYSYKILVLTQQTPEYRRQRAEFCVQLLEKIENNPDFLNSIHFSDKSHFQLSVHVNNQSCRFWASQPTFAGTKAPLTTKKELDMTICLVNIYLKRIELPGLSTSKDM